MLVLVAGTWVAPLVTTVPGPGHIGPGHVMQRSDPALPPYPPRAPPSPPPSHEDYLTLIISCGHGGGASYVNNYGREISP